MFSEFDVNKIICNCDYLIIFVLLMDFFDLEVSKLYFLKLLEVV